MKVSGSSGLGRTQGAVPAGAPKASGGGFAPVVPQAAHEAAAAGPAGGVSGLISVGAMLALQATDTAQERRRKAVRRGGRLLDALEDLKLGLLDGAAAEPLDRLMRAVSEQRQAVDSDPKLASLLNEIETRAAVELAKLQAA